MLRNASDNSTLAMLVQSNCRWLIVFFLLSTCVSNVSAAAQTSSSQTQPLTSTLGYPQQILAHVIPGSPIEPKPITDRDQPVIVRILETYPHGTDHRYDLEFTVLDSGDFNLANYLQRVDANDSQPIPAIPVSIQSLLPDGQIEPAELVPQMTKFYSYYLPAVVIGAAVWLIGLLAILFYGRSKTRRPLPQQKKMTVAQRLQPLVEAAIRGDCTPEQQAELERVLTAHWSEKLRWGHLPAVKIREQLRQHPEASQLLNQLDEWLHRPKAAAGTPVVDVAKLLEPYQRSESDS